MRKSVFIVALLSMVLVALAGCGQALAQVEDDSSGPFYTDRVVTVRLVMDEDDWEYMQRNAIEEQYAKADLWYDGELIADVGVRPKGNSSLRMAVSSGSIRFSLKVDINFFNAARTLYGVKKVNFNNGFSDPTFLREVLAYEIFEDMGLPTPRTAFVDLWVNDTHLGLYTMVEQVDKTFLSNHFEDNSGNLYKPETTAATLNWTEADLTDLTDELSADDVNLGGGKLREILEALGLWASEAEEPNLPADMPPGDMPLGGGPPAGDLPQRPPGGLGQGELPPGGVMPGGAMPGDAGRGNLLEQMGLKTNENSPDHSALLRLLDVLNSESDEAFFAEIEEVLDVDQVLRFLAVSAAIVHLDNYIGTGHNYYLYEVDGVFTVIPWDLNMVFGTFSFSLDRDGLINFYIDEPTSGPVANYPLVRLLSYQPYLDRYHAYLEEIIEGPFSPETMSNRIDELAELIRPYVEADELKFYTTAEFERALGQDLVRDGRGGMGMTPFGLKSFVAERVESIREQLDGELPSASGDGSGNGGQGMMGGGGRGGGPIPR